MKKSVLIVGIIILVILILGGAFLILHKPSETNQLKNISFAGVKIGDKITKTMQKGLILDNFEYCYEYKDILIDSDKNDMISRLGFHQTSTIDEIISEIKDANIKYQGKQLIEVEDFEKNFKDLKKFDEIEENRRTITYQQEDMRLSINIEENKVIGVKLETVK